MTSVFIRFLKWETRLHFYSAIFIVWKGNGSDNSNIKNIYSLSIVGWPIWQIQVFYWISVQERTNDKGKEGAGNDCGSVLTWMFQSRPGSLNMELNSDVNFSVALSFPVTYSLLTLVKSNSNIPTVGVRFPYMNVFCVHFILW